MNVLRRYQLALMLVVLAFLLVAVMFRRLPQEIPIHWGADGQVDEWLSKPWGALLLPQAALLTTLLLIFAPGFCHGGFPVSAPPKFYPYVVAAFAGFLAIVTGAQLLVASGASLNMQQLVVAAAGGLLAITGNYLGKVPRNHLIGIRTPWTLSSDYVWDRTHRFAAPVFVICGTILLLYAAYEKGVPKPSVVLPIIGVMASLPILYSYFLWRQRK
jgi:uncharacterized membrane protein